MHTKKSVGLVAGGLAVAMLGGAAAGQDNLLTDPGFDQFDMFWGTFGAAGINDFFGNPHGSLFADGVGNFGGFFQTGIESTDDTLYRFTLTDVRIEENFNADFRFGLEFYAADDSTKVGEVFSFIDSSAGDDILETGDGLVFSVDVESIAGAVFVRPVVLFDNADPVSSSQANAFVFDASLVVVPAPGVLAGFGGLALMGARRRRA